MRLRRHRPFVAATLAAAVSQAFPAQVTAVWTGAGNTGQYATPSNWNIGVVPLNGVVDTYVVQIGGSAAVGYDVAGPKQVDQLLLDLGTSFALRSSSLIQPSDLTVLGRALLAGSLSADAANFTALGAGTTFAGTRNEVTARNGAVVKIGGTGFDTSGLQANVTIIGAAGSGTRVELAQVQRLNAGVAAANFPYEQRVDAAGGSIVLSGLRDVVAPAFSGGRLRFSATAGGRIDLSSLNTVQGVTLNSGLTSFSADGGSFQLGALTLANRMDTTLSNGATMGIAGSSAVAAISGSSFSATGGSVLAAGGWKGDFVTRDAANLDLLVADGPGSRLELGALRLLDSGAPAANFPYAHQVTATNAAVIDLHGVTRTVAPAFSGGQLVFTANSGARIDLSALSTVQGVTANSGLTLFNADAGTFTLGALASVDRMIVGLDHGATMTVAGGPAAASITGSRFAASGGAVLAATPWVADFRTRDQGNLTLLSATGADSALELGGLRLIDSGAAAANFPYTHTIAVADGGRIDLSGVTRTVAPAFSGGTLQFSATTGGRIDLSALSTVQGATFNSGLTRFTADQGSFALGALASADRLLVDLANQSTLSVAGGPAAAAITGSRFTVSGGSVLAATPWVADFTTRDQANVTLLSADGAGSQLQLGGLRLIDSGAAAANFPYTHAVSASDGGVVDLSGVTRSVAPAFGGGTLLYSATTGGRIDLSRLGSVQGPAAETGHTRFFADQGSLVLGTMQTANRMAVDLRNGATLSVAGSAATAAISNSSFAVSGGARMDAAGWKADFTARDQANLTLLSASGAGSVLNLRGLQGIDSGAAAANFPYTHSVLASDRGLVDLAGVKKLVAPTFGGGTLAFNASSGGRIELPALQSIVNPAGGRVDFSADSGGSLLLAGMTAGPAVHFDVSDDGSTISLLGGLALRNGSTLLAANGGRLDLAGSFSFEQQTASQVNTERGIVDFRASGASLEVGGRDFGLPTAFVAGNFAIGRLEVGSGNAPVLVSLADAVDNAQGLTGEALYLNGIGGGTGLRVLGGSTLALNGVSLYVYDGTQWERLNDRFTGGVTRIAYDQGFITSAVPEPATWGSLLAGLGVIGLRLRRRQLAA